MVAALLPLRASAASAEQPRPPFVRVEAETAERPGDNAAIQSLLARRHGVVWLLDYKKRFFSAAPADRLFEAYLPPRRQRGRLRQGMLWHGFRELRPGGQARWRLVEPPAVYAQVLPPGKRFAPGLAAPGALEGPFEVTGRISDRDLLAVIDLVRSGQPSETVKEAPGKRRRQPATAKDAEDIPAGLISHGIIDHDLPVAHLRVDSLNHVTVFTARRPGSGEVIEVRRRHGRWSIESAAMSVV